ncbi:MAG TPA: rod shape-determining protein MreC [Clostridiaceae bacterium]
MKFIKNKLTIVVVLLSVCFLVLIGISEKDTKIVKSSNAFQNGTGVILNSMQKGVYSLSRGIKDYLSFLFSFNQVKIQNEELKAQNTKLLQKAQDYDSLIKKYDSIAAMVGFEDEKSGYNYLGCEITGISGTSYLDGYIINKGTKDGVNKRMVVVCGDGLVGQITKCEANWSVIQTITNENINVACRVESTQEEGMLKGYKDENNNQMSKLTQLDENSQVQVGAVIYTSNTGAIYPKGIRVGSVLEVSEDKAKLTKTAVIEPFVDFNKLQVVFIVIPKDKTKIAY